jgi:hypothetical protein
MMGLHLPQSQGHGMSPAGCGEDFDAGVHGRRRNAEVRRFARLDAAIPALSSPAAGEATPLAAEHRWRSRLEPARRDDKAGRFFMRGTSACRSAPPVRASLTPSTWRYDRARHRPMPSRRSGRATSAAARGEAHARQRLPALQAALDARFGAGARH